MPREEIIGGLKNALERGNSLEKAVQSFINSGYNPQEVHAAATALSQGATAIIHSPEGKGSEEELPEPPAKKNKSKTKIILIIAIILFLLLIAGAVLFTIFSPETVRRLIG